MNCCCTSDDDPEEMLLRDASVKNFAEVGTTSEEYNGYEEIPNSNKDNNNDNSDNKDTSKQKQTNKKTFCGYGLAFLGVIGISSGLACTQALDKSIPHSELNGFRFTAQFLITAPLLAGFRRCDVTLEKRSIGWMSFGAIVLTLSSYMQYGAAYYLPLGIASGVIRSCGLVMNYAISCVVKRALVWYEFLAAVLCLSGVAMITQPAFLFPASVTSASSVLSTHDTQDSLNQTFWSPCHIRTNVLRPQPDANGSLADRENVTAIEADLLANAKAERSKEQIMGYSFCFIEAVLSTVYIQLVSRRLSDVNIFVYNFWISLFGSITSFCIMGASETPVLPTVGVCVVFLVVHMFSAGTHNILLYRAYQLIDPVVAGLILTLQIAFTFILQYTALYRLHPGRANALEISGAVVIFVGNALVPGYQALLSKCRQRKETG